jgi:hypothetical protein
MPSPIYPPMRRLTQRVKHLPSGVYIATSFEPAYAQLKAMILRGQARPLTDRFIPGGGREIVAVVGTASLRRNEAEQPGEWRETQITFSKRYFQNVKKDYGRFEDAWWREVIQNAVDAGATQITLGYEENDDGTRHVWCDDNGRGMSTSMFENVFLALGSTTKEDSPGQRGGFGKAREMILFPWLGWEVISNDFQSRGMAFGGPNGEPKPLIRSIPRRQGTNVSVIMPSDAFTDHSYSEEYLNLCNLPHVQFTLTTINANGQRDRSKPADFAPRGEEIDSIPGLCTFTFFKHSTYRGFYFRVLGQYLFRTNLNSEADGGVLVDILVKSTDVLTANRDSLSDSPQGIAIKNKLSQVSSRLATDKLSAQKAKRQGLLHKADAPANDYHAGLCADLIESMPPLPFIASEDEGVTLSPEAVNAQVDKTDSVLQTYSPVEARTLTVCSGDWAKQALGILYIRGQNQYETAIKHLTWRPQFAVYTQEDSEWARDDRWKAFMPGAMNDRLASGAKLWIEVCRLVLMQMNEFEPWGVGFFLGGDRYEGTAAATLRDYDEKIWLLINPVYADSVKDVSKPGQWRDLVSSAIHECTHFVDGYLLGNVRGHSREEFQQGGHDESFTTAIARNTALAAPVFAAERFMLSQVPIMRKMIPRKYEREQNYSRTADALDFILRHWWDLAQLDAESRSTRVSTNLSRYMQAVWEITYALSGWMHEETPATGGEFADYAYFALGGGRADADFERTEYLRLYGTSGCGLEIVPLSYTNAQLPIILRNVYNLPSLTRPDLTHVVERLSPEIRRKVDIVDRDRVFPESEIVAALKALRRLEQTLERLAAGGLNSSTVRDLEEQVRGATDQVQQYLQFGRNLKWWKEPTWWVTERLISGEAYQLAADAGFLGVDKYGSPLTWILKTQSPEMIWKWTLLHEYAKSHAGKLPDTMTSKIDPAAFESAKAPR